MLVQRSTFVKRRTQSGFIMIFYSISTSTASRLHSSVNSSILELVWSNFIVLIVSRFDVNAVAEITKPNLVLMFYPLTCLRFTHVSCLGWYSKSNCDTTCITKPFVVFRIRYHWSAFRKHAYGVGHFVHYHSGYRSLAKLWLLLEKPHLAGLNTWPSEGAISEIPFPSWWWRWLRVDQVF